MPSRIGIVGYGNLGKYLTKYILENPDNYYLAFVWNRTLSAVEQDIPSSHILKDLDNFSTFKPDLIIEVAHPEIVKNYGAKFLQFCDFLVGSPSAFADRMIETELRSAANCYGLYIPSGALWGGEDIFKMDQCESLQALKITMCKPPQSLKVLGRLKTINDAVTTERTILYDGPVRELCELAPNNVNTMAAAAMAAGNLGFDEVQGCLVADPSLTLWHIIEIDVWGDGNIANDTAFHVKTIRRNPAAVGNVTGSATYASFANSLARAHGKGPGVHLC